MAGVFALILLLPHGEDEESDIETDQKTSASPKSYLPGRSRPLKRLIPAGSRTNVAMGGQRLNAPSLMILNVLLALGVRVGTGNLRINSRKNCIAFRR
jgi:hypothetical protein